MPPAFAQGSVLADAPEPRLPNLSRTASTGAEPKTKTRTKRQWAGQHQQAVGSLVGLTLLAAGAWAAWRWWRSRTNTAAQQDTATHQATPQRKHKKSGYASPFSFDRRKNSHTHQEPVSAVQAVPVHHTSNRRQSPPKGKGNPKKDKRKKQSRKEAKRAKEHELREADSVAALIAARAKAKGVAEAGQTPDTGLVTTHSYEANAEAFQRVQQWQETGKKAFK